VLLFDVRAMGLISELTDHTKTVSSVEWSPGGRFLASGSWDYTVRVWAHEGLRCVKTLGRAYNHRNPLEGHTGRVYGVAWTAGGGLASCSQDGTVRRWAAHEEPQ
jgi:WD40 repeat protein